MATQVASKENKEMPSGDADEQTTQDLTEFVQNLLHKMHERFQEMSDSIVGRLDTMGKRLDELESNIGELMTQAGVEDDISKINIPQNDNNLRDNNENNDDDGNDI